MKKGTTFYIKLSVLIAFVVTGGLLWQDFGQFSASAHDGHRHAPASETKAFKEED